MLMPAGERTGWKRIKKSISSLGKDFKRKKKDFKEQQEEAFPSVQINKKKLQMVKNEPFAAFFIDL